METATDKQIYFLKSQGIDVPDSISKQVASELISNIKAMPGSKVVKQPQTEFIEKQGFKKPVYNKKPSFDNTSYYVAYAKDLAVAMINAMKPGEIDTLSVEIFMDKAIAMIKQAKAELG